MLKGWVELEGVGLVLPVISNFFSKQAEIVVILKMPDCCKLYLQHGILGRTHVDGHYIYI